MRRAVLLSLSLIVGGCVPTADFVELRDEVRELQAEKRKLKETEAELRKRLEEADRLQKSGDVAPKVEALEAKIESLRIRQQGFDQKVGELPRPLDESTRREEEPALPQAKAPAPGVKPDDTAAAKPKAGRLDVPLAALTPTAAYNQAYNDYLKGNYDLAVAGFEEFLKKFPETSLTAHAQYWIGEAYFNKRSYLPAIEAYERVIANYPKSDKVPAALAKAGVAYAELGNLVKARGLLKRVTDDGQGMTPEEAALAFQRHATSKIRTEGDLFTIQSMGFRGEALPSIAAVSKVRLVTVAAGASVGAEIRLEGGALHQQRETAAAPGTMVEVTDLFYNPPARQKFLKSPATEFGHVCQVVQRQALAFPDIHFRLTHNGHAVADYPVVPTLRDRVQQVYGAELVDASVGLREEAGRFRLEGLCARPLETALTRTPQDLFVNRRWVKNATIVHAVYEGYGTYLARGHQPRFVLSLWVDPRQVDVNVHPTKREVRFADQEQVHEWVRSRIQASVTPASVSSRETVVSSWALPGSSDRPVARDGTRDVPEYAGLASDVRAERQQRLAGVAEPRQAYLPAVAQEEGRPLGQIASRYLGAQVGEEIQIGDQHTSHERVLFERPQRPSVACHSAVRAGRVLEVPEIRRLLEDWRVAGLPSTCPHGRRIAMRLTIEELDRIFGRLGWHDDR